MVYDKFLWHIAEHEKKSDLQASLIHGLIGLVKTKTGKDYKTILDVPCGNCRLHKYLESLGYGIEGFDITPALIEEGKETGAKCWVGDMTKPGDYKEKKYDVILNWFSSFGYWRSDEDSKRVLKIWNKGLMENGLLIIDTATAYVERKDIIREVQPGVYEIMLSRPTTGFEELWVRIVLDDGRELRTLSELKIPHKLYTVSEMKSLLEGAGFELIDVLERNRMKRTSDEERPQGAVYLAVKRV